MLYVSTRNQTEQYTANQAYATTITPDDGFYMPITIPMISREEMDSFSQLSFAQVVTRILNIFFSNQFSEWEIELCVGKNPVPKRNVTRKIVIAKLWNEIDTDFEKIIQRIHRVAMKSTNKNTGYGSWSMVSIRVAVLFGLFSQLDFYGFPQVDVAISDMNLDVLFSVWYAKQMGLPVGKIICGCHEGNTIWRLFQRGEIIRYMEYPVLERLLWCKFGTDMIHRLVNAEKKYILTEEQLRDLGEDIFLSIVSEERIGSIRFTFRSCFLNEDLSYAYGALQDFRAVECKIRPTLMLAEHYKAL